MRTILQTLVGVSGHDPEPSKPRESDVKRQLGVHPAQALKCCCVLEPHLTEHPSKTLAWKLGQNDAHFIHLLGCGGHGFCQTQGLGDLGNQSSVGMTRKKGYSHAWRYNCIQKTVVCHFVVNVPRGLPQGHQIKRSEGPNSFNRGAAFKRSPVGRAPTLSWGPQEPTNSYLNMKNSLGFYGRTLESSPICLGGGPLH